MYWHRFICKEWNYTADILSSQFLPTQKLQQLMMRIMIIIDKFRMVSAQLLPSFPTPTPTHPGHPFLFSSSAPVDNEDDSDPVLCVCLCQAASLLPTLLAFRILSTLVLLPPTSTSSATTLLLTGAEIYTFCLPFNSCPGSNPGLCVNDEQLKRSGRRIQIWMAWHLEPPHHHQQQQQRHLQCSTTGDIVCSADMEIVAQDVPMRRRIC